VSVTRLTVYNGALREAGERSLASLSENREPRRLLDDIWNDGAGLLRFVLQAKQWRFGRRTVKLSADPDITPDFGYRYAFGVPTDHVRTCAVSEDQYLQTPLLAYQIESGYWYADIDQIYVSYISTDTSYGGDLSKWPPNFTLWVETHMASLIAGRLTGSKANRNDLIKLAAMRLKEAAATDAMESPTQFPPGPQGTFVRARAGRQAARYDRGSRTRLTG